MIFLAYRFGSLSVTNNAGVAFMSDHLLLSFRIVHDMIMMGSVDSFELATGYSKRFHENDMQL